MKLFKSCHCYANAKTTLTADCEPKEN